MTKVITKAILLMGGEGLRFGATLPKQFLRLSGKKIYLHTLDAFLPFPEFQEILLVCHKDWVEKVEKECSSSRIRVLSGGRTRQESSYLGLLACGSETNFVVIHDAVRPFVSKKTIQENLDSLKKHLAVDTCIPSQDTIVYAKNLEEITSIPNRLEYLRGQTPQSFSYPLILRAHQKAEIENASDDCRLVLNLGEKVHIVLGSEDNIKITTELDLFLAEQLIRLKTPSPSSAANAPLKGKTFAITGGMGGIGSALASLLEKEGAFPLILSRSSPSYPIDLTSYSAIQKTFAEIHQKHGPLDGLINCIGHLKVQPFHSLSSEEIDNLLAVNFKSFLYSCHLVQLKEGGHIVNLSSSSFTRGRKDYALYSSAKAAIVNFTQALAEEKPALNINTVIPQRTNTSMRRENFPDELPETLLSPEEVAQEIVALLKQEKITNTLIEVRKK